MPDFCEALAHKWLWVKTLYWWTSKKGGKWMFIHPKMEPYLMPHGQVSRFRSLFSSGSALSVPGLYEEGICLGVPQRHREIIQLQAAQRQVGILETGVGKAPKRGWPSVKRIEPCVDSQKYPLRRKITSGKGGFQQLLPNQPHGLSDACGDAMVQTESCAASLADETILLLQHPQRKLDFTKHTHEIINTQAQHTHK